jgi:hypothetical protein
MALETQYVVESHANDGYPVIYRVIKANGVEVAKGEATFLEAKSAYPAVVEEYFNAAAAWAHDFANYLDQHKGF